MSVVRATFNLSLLAVVATTKVVADTTTAVALHLLDEQPARVTGRRSLARG